MPVCRDLKNGLLEVRTNLKDKICRILFAMCETRMVLLHGFIKKDQNTPTADMHVALKRKKEMETRK
jgi:phage-related protein